MAIEAIAASILAKEVAGQTAVEATKQLAEKMAVESLGQTQLTQSLEQTTGASKFRIGEVSSAELEKKNILAFEEKKAASELNAKIESAEIKEPFRDTGENCLTSYEERFRQTPKDGWEGERGESVCKKEIESMGEVKVEYKNSIPDFSPYAKETVEIPNMCGERYGEGGNFEQADTALAEQWNKAGFESRNNWTGAEVRDWRRENLPDYTWHECSDRMTCQLIPRDVNGTFGHLGGVGECKKLASFESVNFD